MKVVVTITQCRRAVLPWIFVEYVLPEMRRLFPGTVEAVIIQHRADASGGNTGLESLQHGSVEYGLALVRRWTAEGRYAAADIVAHDIVHRPYPSIPSYHLAVREALARNADFHLWMEDDALVFDRQCGQWDRILGGTEVGCYRRHSAHLHSAYLLTRPSFDHRILLPLADYERWSWRHRIEPFLRQHQRTRRTLLRRHYAVRYHHRYYPYTGLRYVVDALREIAPGAAPLLDLDFGPGCADLPPVSVSEMRRHEAQEGAGVVDTYWRTHQYLVERLLLPACACGRRSACDGHPTQHRSASADSTATAPTVPSVELRYEVPRPLVATSVEPAQRTPEPSRARARLPHQCGGS
jgi:hypothetical protein